MTANISVGWEQLLQQGKQASSQQDFGRAEVLFNNALEQAFSQSAPEAASGEIFFHLGWCLEAQGRIQDAIKRYKHLWDRWSAVTAQMPNQQILFAHAC